MGSGGAARDLRISAFQDNQRFLFRQRFAGDGQEFSRLFESLHKSRYHARALIFNEVVNIFFDGDSGLIAAGNDVTQADPAVVHQGVGDCGAESAALRYQSHRAREKTGGNHGTEKGSAAEYVKNTVAVRTADEQVVFFCKGLEFRLSFLSFRTDFGKATGENHGRAD